jgi:hypothetical protein
MNTLTSTQIIFFDNLLFYYYGDLLIYGLVFTILFFGLVFIFNKFKFWVKRF